MKNTEPFEKEIAYFFGVDHEGPVVKAYLKAIKKLEEIGPNGSKKRLHHEMMPYLENAYKEIAHQRNLNFDTTKAADIEFQIILGNALGSTFEIVQDLMIQLYTVIFQTHSPAIKKAAMLRTFLYQYKAEVMKEGEIPLDDQELMIEVAKASEKYLSLLS
ncbi:MAG: hypothetical protein JSS10_08525 [Verrucomicrobia bacterium]|nr:hypothetical protein [Verrucomicrobiota bacterium]